MLKLQNAKGYYQYMAKMANSKSEVEKINTSVQYFASLGLSDYYYSYDVKKVNNKEITAIKKYFVGKGFVVEDEYSGIKNHAMLHFFWGRSTQGFAFKLRCVYERSLKTKEFTKKILKSVEKAANNGEFSVEYDLRDAGSLEFIDDLLDKSFRIGDFSKVELNDKKLTLEWRI